MEKIIVTLITPEVNDDMIIYRISTIKKFKKNISPNKLEIFCKKSLGEIYIPKSK